LGLIVSNALEWASASLSRRILLLVLSHALLMASFFAAIWIIAITGYFFSGGSLEHLSEATRCAIADENVVASTKTGVSLFLAILVWNLFRILRSKV
jgi:hypothetical protein